MTLRRFKDLFTYAAFGFCSDVAATRFCLSVSRRDILEAVVSNIVLMALTVCFVRRAKDAWIMACWIMGQSAGIAAALML